MQFEPTSLRVLTRVSLVVLGARRRRFIVFIGYHKVQPAVLERTLELIIEKELQATSMGLIAKKSGVSTRNIYHYF